jgi:hypothetical protein
VGINEAAVNDLSVETIDRLEKDLAALTQYPVLRDMLYSEAEQEMRDEAWSGRHITSASSCGNLSRIYEELDARLDALTEVQERRLFELLRERANEEWDESSGGMSIGLNKIIDHTVESMPSAQQFGRYLDGAFPGQHQMRLNLESLIDNGSLEWIGEAERQFSSVPAPAPPDLSDYVLQWGNAFVTDDELL